MNAEISESINEKTELNPGHSIIDLTLVLVLQSDLKN